MKTAKNRIFWLITMLVITLTLGFALSSCKEDEESAVASTQSLIGQQTFLKAANNDAGNYFGYSVSLSGETLAVGAIGERSNQTTITNGIATSNDYSSQSSGAVYVYKRSGAAWGQEAYIKAANNDADDYFGDSVSLSGDTLAVGTYKESSNQSTITNGATASADNSNENSGAVYIYTRNGVIWSQQAYIKASNNDASGDYFGDSVSLSGDTLAVGAYKESSNQTTITNGADASNDNSNADSGAVYVYRRSDAVWIQEAYLKASNNDASGDNFGFSVSLSDDTLAVGAYREGSNQTTITNGPDASADNSNYASGAVYVYRRVGTAWTQEAYIKASNNDSADLFGYSVSLSNNTLAVGAYLEAGSQASITNGDTASDDNSKQASGAVYVFRRRGDTWTQEAYIKASNSDASDNFGRSVSLSGDKLAVGVYNEDSDQNTITIGTSSSSNNSNPASGAVYLYQRSDDTWTQTAYIKAANNDADDYFGESISLSGDTLAVGASREDSNQDIITNGSDATADDSNADSGAVYIYR